MHLARAVHEAGIPDEDSGETYRELAAILRRAAQARRITSPKGDSKANE